MGQQSQSQSQPIEAPPIDYGDVIVAVGGGMNWTWFLAYSFNPDGSLLPLCEERFHRFDYDQGADMETALSAITKAQRSHWYRVIENPEYLAGTCPERLAIAIEIDGTEHPITPCSRFKIGKGSGFNWKQLIKEHLP